jgi:Xaa-Pro aminopeptidase
MGNTRTNDNLSRRRQRLAEAIGDFPALISAGRPQPRNYPASTYPFRASSHFLYCFGVGIPGAHALLRGGSWTVYAPQVAEDDALWHGPTPTRAEWEEQLGCAVRPLSELEGAINTEPFATMPVTDPATQAEVAEQINRCRFTTGARSAAELNCRLVEAVIALRLIHDTEAIDGLERAAEATADAHRAGMGRTAVGQTEAEVRASMEAALVERGMTTSYNPIVTVHGEILHNERQTEILADGDLLLADVGAETPDGWAGDVTRTWPATGKFSPSQRAIYEVVLASQLAAIEATTVGRRFRDVHLIAAKSMTEGLVALGILRGDPATLVNDGVHALFFPHGIGHLIGLDVHDMEDLGDAAGYAFGRIRSTQFGLSYLRLDRDMQPGMAVTIEPGFYQVPAILESDRFRKMVVERVDRAELAKYSDVRGIRIEDCLLVTAADPRVLTAAIPKAIDAVEAAVGA